MAAEESPFQVKHDGDQVVISSEFFNEGDDGETWRVQQIDERRLLLMAEDDQSQMGKNGDSVASCSTEVFKDFLIALTSSRWSGTLYIDTGYGTKRLFLSKGHIVFAASSVMDDRLGEVIYRGDMISLDELTDSAAQVTKKKKFGQVLINSEIFTNVQLWEALKLQTQTILRSLFMVDRVFYQLEADTTAPTEVVFKRGPDQLIQDSYAYGASFRDFLSRLRAESEVHILIPQDELESRYQPGTFVGDLLAMVAEESNVQELLNKSKLMDINTIAALADLVHHGYCAVKPDVDSAARSLPEMSMLKAKLDAHSFVLASVKKAFGDAQVSFPIEEIVEFANKLNPLDFRTFYVNPDGTMNKDCINNMFSQCHSNPARSEFFVARINAMIQFLLQVSGDNLEWNVAKGIRGDYRSISG